VFFDTLCVSFSFVFFQFIYCFVAAIYANKDVYITPPPIGERSIAMSVSVCPSCLSVREHISGTTRPIFAKFLRMLPTAVTRSSSGGVAICYVLPVYR